MPKAVRPESDRALVTCPSCGSREPKEIVGSGRRMQLHCADCGKDFVQKKRMGVFALLFAAGSLIFAFLVIKQRLPMLQESSRTEFVEIEDVTTKADGQMTWSPSPDRPMEPIVNSGAKVKKPPESTMSANEREIRQKWGWDSKGTSLDQPAR